MSDLVDVSVPVPVPVPVPEPAIEPASDPVPETTTESTEQSTELAMSEHTYKYKVKMTCGGCSGAVSKVLERAKKDGAVDDYTVTLETQEVLVKGSIPFEDLTAKIAKTGKEILEKEELV